MLILLRDCNKTALLVNDKVYIPSLILFIFVFIKVPFTSLYFWEVWIMCMYILYTRLAISGMFWMTRSGCPEASLWRNVKRKIVLNPRNDVKEWQCRTTLVLLAVVLNYWHDANVKVNYSAPARYLLVIWNFSFAASSDVCSRSIRSSRGCRVCNLTTLVCRQSLSA